ncbi:hypothetical protein [Cronobacter malonaticus]|uniref:hypothetical protein n=1 Tax=Cronobacter malonaticus TaxID=413503 RepID=UPI002936F83A|nr:hypothetical protein [Cronobacter malonaticus]
MNNIKELTTKLEAIAQHAERGWQEAHEQEARAEAAEKRVAELEQERASFRVIGVVSEAAFHRLENRECRFIALWPRPEIYLPRPRPSDGAIVYARVGGALGINLETGGE